MTKQQLKDWLLMQGWAPDRWGNFHKMGARMKLGHCSVRLEKKVGKVWVRMRGAYYTQLSITQENKLRGLRRNALRIGDYHTYPFNTQ